MELALRLGLISDLPLLGEIRRQSIMAQPETFWTYEEKQRAADAWSKMDIQQEYQQYKVFVTSDNSAFIGWKQNYLGYLFVLPAAQRKGFGAELLKIAEEEIRQQYNDIWLIAHPYSEIFYTSHGFVKQPETETPFGPGKPLHKFLKKF